MASDRHGKHNKPTIAFRVTPYEQQVIGIENCRARLMTFNRRQIILITLWSKENAQIYEQQQKKLEYLNGNS